MAVILFVAAQRYLGLSTDTKPAAPRAGALFYETDSQRSYQFDGTAWQPLTEALR